MIIRVIRAIRRFNMVTSIFGDSFMFRHNFSSPQVKWNKIIISREFVYDPSQVA